MQKSKQTAVRLSNVAIIGPGRLGQALGKLLADRGMPVRLVAARNLRRARSAARFIGRARAVRLDDKTLQNTQVILLTISDSAIEAVADDLAKRRKDWNGKIVLHTCGSLPARVLDSLRRRGAAIGSLHPYQTIPSREDGVRNLIGTVWSVEGDAAAEKLARQWVRRLNGKVFRIRAGSKPLYHLSAFLVCPSLIALMDQSEKLLCSIGVSKSLGRRLLAQFVAETARNFGQRGGKRALTGPVARGDWATIRRHVDELRRVAPQTLPAYRELVRLMARLAGRKISANCLKGSR